jgi:hypothetical protein
MIQAVQNIQSQYLAEFIHNYNQRTNTSKQIAQKFRLYLADNKFPDFFYFPLKELAYPFVGQRSLRKEFVQ